MLESIPKEAYGMIGTLLGAIIGIVGTITVLLLTPRFQRALEEGKLRAARQDAWHKELLNRMQSLSVDLASAAHSMTWLTWASNTTGLKAETIKSYDQELHSALAKIMGGVVTVTALDADFGKGADEIALELYALDAKIGHACAAFENDPDRAKAMIIDVTPKVIAFERSLRTRLGDMAREKSAKLLEAPIFDRGPPAKA